MKTDIFSLGYCKNKLIKIKVLSLKIIFRILKKNNNLNEQILFKTKKVSFTTVIYAYNSKKSLKTIK